MTKTKSTVCRESLRGTLRFALALSALALSWSPAVSGETRIELQPYVGRLRQVPVQIADHEYRFLFDTGGGDTLVSPRIAAAIGCTPSGRLLGFRMSGEQFATPKCANVSLKIGKFETGPVTVGVFDLMTLLPKDIPPIDGLISLKSFNGQSIELDLARNRLTVLKGPIRSARRQKFLCRAATGPAGAEYTLFAAIERNGRHWFLVDSGNLDKVLLAPHAAEAFGLNKSTNEESAHVAITLGATEPVQLAARTENIIYDGSLNAAFLEKGVLSAELSLHPRCSWTPHQSPSPQD